MEFFQTHSSSPLPPASPVHVQMDGAFMRHDGNQENNDIYRGRQPETCAAEDPRPISPSSTSSSSSSSAASGRLGAIAAVVELAITRWRNSSTSSFSASSTSIATHSRPARRRRRRSSVADRNARSERDVVARIKARQETRRVPREFVLYVPPVLQVSFPGILRREQHPADENGMLRTYLLPTVLHRLNATIKASTRLRPPDQAQSSQASTSNINGGQPTSGSGRQARLHNADALLRAAEGSRKESKSNSPSGSIHLVDLGNRNQGQQPAWWLDVSSPTGEDMRALGKLLHLHPLTLEDILSRDPREKLELFPKLGYYFVVFKAIESEKTRGNIRRSAHKDGESPFFVNDGIVGEDLIYLVVLRGGKGLCTFHFTDISEHLDHVRNKVLLLDENVNKSSDWIAHCILDSVVDSFFPFLYEIEKEAREVEDVVFANDISKPKLSKWPTIPEKVTASEGFSEGCEKVDYESTCNEKLSTSAVNASSVPTGVSLPPTTIPILLHRAKRVVNMRSNMLPATVGRRLAPVSSSTLTVHRMARTRRLVTTLTRLLATKADLIAQIRKRLLTKEEWTLGSDPELYIHMGDILDHILTLQQGLAHYEKTLSESHPIYLHQLHILAWVAKSAANKATVILTSVGVSILSIQVIIGLCSLNITIPTNGSLPTDRYYIFGIVLVLMIVILSGFAFVVRYMWVQAERKKHVF